MSTEDDLLTIFVFVRTDLPLPDQIVQVGHVCVAATVTFGVPSSCRLVLIGVDDQMALQDAIRYCDSREIRTIAFHEPDTVDATALSPMGLTAICTEPLSPYHRRLLRKYRLWSAHHT